MAVPSTLYHRTANQQADNFSFMKPAKPEWHNEDRIEEAFRAWLTSHGWQVQYRTGQSGADISAVDQHNVRWLFEVKGYPATYKKLGGETKSESSKRTQRRIWFIEALGQSLTRITDPDFRIGIIFPDHPTDAYFQKAALSLPQFLRDKLDLWVFLVGQESFVRVLSPDSLRFEDAIHTKLS